MAFKEHSTDRFKDVEEQESETTKWQARYHGLLQELKVAGTEVRVMRTLEEDKDNAPFHFVRDAFHDFIFPPQGVTAVGNNSGIIDSTPGYSLEKEDRLYSYQTDLVKGHILVYYDDADSRIDFSVETKVIDEAPLPPAADEALDQAFVE